MPFLRGLYGREWDLFTYKKTKVGKRPNYDIHKLTKLVDRLREGQEVDGSNTIMFGDLEDRGASCSCAEVIFIPLTYIETLPYKRRRIDAFAVSKWIVAHLVTR